MDELTGLYTRREFDDAIHLEFERRRRHGTDLSLIVIEIDDIAELGEHVGKLSKGYLLSEVSAILRNMLRAIDIGCRYSPDSLALLLPETNSEQALAVADKVRSAIEGHEFLGQFAGEAMRVTVSQGIASGSPEMSSHVHLMRAAERALYDARAAGFDQVHVYAPDASEPGELKAAS
jgi:diguanylate cyclase (GGDEF)-like protein